MNNRYDYSMYPLGDNAVLVDFGNIINEEINKAVLNIFSILQNRSLYGVLDIVPAYSSLTVFYDIIKLKDKIQPQQTVFDLVAKMIKDVISENETMIIKEKQRHQVPVCYAENFALDINDIAAEKGLPIEEVISLHTSKAYRVYMIGFLPGFAYMGEVEELIAVPRRNEPRAKVPGGSIGIAGKQTGIYPFDAPGGWQIIGRTPMQIFNKDEHTPVLFQPGDEVIFYPITEDEFINYKSRHF
jgi:inhibitor of KinA